MTRIWTDFRVRDTALVEKSIIEDALMTLRDNISVHTQNVRSSMDLRDL